MCVLSIYIHSSCYYVQMFLYYLTPLIPAAYGGIYKSTFSILLTTWVLCLYTCQYALYWQFWGWGWGPSSILIVYIDITGYSMYTFFCTIYYVFSTYHLSLWWILGSHFLIPIGIQNFIFYVVPCGYYIYIYILYKILVIFVVIYDY